MMSGGGDGTVMVCILEEGRIVKEEEGHLSSRVSCLISAGPGPALSERESE